MKHTGRIRGTRGTVRRKGYPIRTLPRVGPMVSIVGGSCPGMDGRGLNIKDAVFTIGPNSNSTHRRTTSYRGILNK